MAKNFKQDGSVLTLIAPAGGVISGAPVVVGALMVVPLEDAAVGQPFSAKTDGVWTLPAADGLAQGAKVSLLDGELVAAATASSVPFGYLAAASANGFAPALLIQQ